MSAGGEKKRTACVTGGSGYIASALIKMLLEKGYAVKTTVRNPDDMEKNSHLKDLQALGSLEVFRADLDEEGSFDEAVAGCDYAFLVAAPVNIHTKNPEKELIEPAVKGTLNVLRSCVKAGTVRRVILTSSAAAVSSRPLQGDGHVLDEDSWSDVEYLTAKKSAIWGYPVSKVLLEKEAFRFAQEHGVSLVTVCPVVTVGAAPATKAQTSVPSCLSLLSGDQAAFAVLDGIERATGCIPLVHIDDLCRAELFVAEEEASTGSSGDRLLKPRVFLSSAKLVREGFEFKYKTLEHIYDDMVEYGKALGILPSHDDMAKNSHFKTLQTIGPLEVFRADLDEEGSFDDALAGCDYAFLVAAPVNLMSANPEACMQSGWHAIPQQLSPVLLCSVQHLPDLQQGDGHVLDEDSWSDVEFLRAEKPPGWGYVVSKVLLEKAASRFALEHGISLVTVCPVITAGAAPAPTAHTSVPGCLSLLSGDEAAFNALRGMEAFGVVALVHVDDLCRAELFVAEEATAAGRYICCSLNTTVREIASFLSEKYPQYTVKTNLLSGDLLDKPRVCLSSAKLEREGFEFRYKTLGGMYDDMIEYGKALGILPS
ncbi:hypothetical protein HU200_012371 [Digitaria exilis]|uniref:NAD-dependent epimerase/dehydratase domain-containing protein n=1 Tax=Digitaria exilis TaxID=1010633 RepID=A0A835KPS9_9POAL|nr:hypothetical protein HU200_012371 [Digitaria exilis]